MHPSDLGPLLHADHTLPPCPRNRFYHEHVKELVAGAVAPGQRVLDLGCGTGDVLATVRPSPGLGLNVGDQLTQLAREKYPDLRFETFDPDTVVLPDDFRPDYAQEPRADREALPDTSTSCFFPMRPAQ
jgi:hypothetical protein